MRRLLAALLLVTVSACGSASAPPVAEAPVVWGDSNEGLRLSLAVNSQVVKKDQPLSIHLRAENITEKEMKLDAYPPSFNDCALIIINPKGEEQTVQAWADSIMDLTIAPGEKDFGEFEVTYHVQRYKQKGRYQITWRLHKTLSNTVQVVLK